MAAEPKPWQQRCLLAPVRLLAGGINCLFWAQGDFPASRMINSVHGVDPARQQELMEVLDVNPDWRMHMVSDGQRRRVQLCLGLLQPFK